MTDNDWSDDELLRTLSDGVLRVAAIHAELMQANNSNAAIIAELIRRRKLPADLTDEMNAHKAFCGHFSDDELTRTLEFKQSFLNMMRDDVHRIEHEVQLILAERISRSHNNLPLLDDDDEW